MFPILWGLGSTSRRLGFDQVLLVAHHVSRLWPAHSRPACVVVVVAVEVRGVEVVVAVAVVVEVESSFGPTDLEVDQGHVEGMRPMGSGPVEPREPAEEELADHERIRCLVWTLVLAVEDQVQQR